MLLNGLNLAEGGPWTWVRRGDPSCRSCLDLAIASANLVPYVTKMKIDSERKFTPRRVMRKRGKITTVYADHFAVQVVLAGMPRAICQKTGGEASWNLQRPGGWQLYEELTNQEAEKILKIVENTSIPIDEVIKKIDTIETKIKFRAFGKTKPSTNKTKQGNRVSTNPCQKYGGTGVVGGSSTTAGTTSHPCQEDGGTGGVGGSRTSGEFL